MSGAGKVLKQARPDLKVIATEPAGAALLSGKDFVLTHNRSFAGIHRAPLLGPSLRRAERLASRSPFRYFGGFLVMVLRKS